MDETDVGTEVDQGAVVLTGTVTSIDKTPAAVEAAHRARDVTVGLGVHLPGVL